MISVSDGQMFYFVCFVMYWLMLVLKVGVKNIPNLNNHVPFGQLRDLTVH